jgi:fused signal recognition particle receptor
LFFLMKFFDRFRKDKERKEAAQSGQAPAVETPAPPPAAATPAPAPVPVVAPAPVPAAEPKAPVPEPKPAAVETAAAEARRPGLFARLKAGLKRTSSSFNEGVGNLFLGKKEIDDELLEELETQLLLADVGIEATQAIVGNLAKRVSRKELADAQALYRALQEELKALLLPGSTPLVIDGAKKPYVILLVGVNGVGKTTTIGKLAKRFRDEGRSVLLAAGDTFRAAAVEQLQVWGERNGVPVIAQHTGADSASVLFDALQAAQARQVDVLIADTAGRLHNKDHLMEELKKVVRVLKKLDPSAPHEVMLVLDAGTGQNALAQARHFQSAVGVTGITLTKLDGTAKGGIIFAVSRQCGLPIRFIGVGEQAEDLRPFEAEEFVRALFQQEPSTGNGSSVQESPTP